MSNLDLIGRIKRTYACQKKHFFYSLWSKFEPESFWKHPYWMQSIWYAYVTGKLPHIRHPRNFNEQLMKLSTEAINDPEQRRLRVLCADKYAVRQYIEEKGCGDILNELYGVYDRFEDIDFSQLPNRFVVKTNYGCGQNLICKDKQSLDMDKWRKQFDEWMAILNFGLTTGEWHYTEIPHKIIVEKYLDSLGNDTMTDYKFHCFHGKVFGCLNVFDREKSAHGYTLCHYDTQWNQQDYLKPEYNPDHKQIKKPENLDQMLKIAETLSADFPYCRVDLYNLDGQIVFGELTFTPAGNIMAYYSDEALRKMLRFYNETK